MKERLTTDQKVPGLNPGGSTICCFKFREMEIFLDIFKHRTFDGFYLKCVSLTEQEFHILKKYENSCFKLYILTYQKPVMGSIKYQPYTTFKVKEIQIALKQKENEYILLDMNGATLDNKFCYDIPADFFKYIRIYLNTNKNFDRNHVYISDDKELIDNYCSAFNNVCKEFAQKAAALKSRKCLWHIERDLRHCDCCAAEYCLERTALPDNINPGNDGFFLLGNIEKLKR